MSIYSLMKKDWEVYCLMAGIMYIEELKKPDAHIQIKTYKGRKSEYIGYHTLRLKGKEYEIIKKWFDITKLWERKFSEKFIGDSFSILKKDESSGQFYFIFSPNWLYHILKTVKIFPSKYVQNVSLKRLKNWKKGKYQYFLSKQDVQVIESGKSLYEKLFENKKLAAGAMVVSFDLEFRGATIGQLNLTMSEKYKDFLNFMLDLANKWNWATSNKLYPVSVEYSKNLGINASPQFGFRISMKGLREIYPLAGPLISKVNNKAVKFQVERVNLPDYNKANRLTYEPLVYGLVREKGPIKSTELQYFLNSGIPNLLKILNKLHKEGKIIKTRQGKRYMWSIEDAYKCEPRISKVRKGVCRI